MILSIDIGIKNFGVCVYDKENGCMKYLDNINFFPYNLDKLIVFMNDLTEKYTITETIIEKQLPQNYKACLVAAHLEVYFKLKLPECNLIFQSSKLKGIGKQPNYQERKSSSVKKAGEFLKEKESDFYTIFREAKKKDDMADAICQLMYYCNI